MKYFICARTSIFLSMPSMYARKSGSVVWTETYCGDRRCSTTRSISDFVIVVSVE